MDKPVDLQEADLKVQESIEGMIKAEETAIKNRPEFQQKNIPEENNSLDRRKFLTAAAVAGVGAAGVISNKVEAAAPPGAIEYPVPDDPTKVQGRLTNADGGYGSRSQFENEVRWRFPTATKESSWTMTPLDKSKGMITPSGLHFERHHAGIPNIDPKKHTLVIHGMVERPMQFTMDQLSRFPSSSRMHFIECSGNGLTEWKKPTLKTVQGTHGLTSTSEWTGVPLSTILSEVGVKPEAKWILAEGGDSALMTRSVPIAKCWKDAVLAYAQNGEALRPEQGYPLRLLLPGWEGNTHIKWLRRIQISDSPFMTREETSKYTDLLDGGKARQFSYTMEAKSVVTSPSGEMKLNGPGFYEIEGLAWSGNGKIKRVEVSTDGGKKLELREFTGTNFTRLPYEIQISLALGWYSSSYTK
jgi:sulfane dehydrogenase subunit SoxC